MSYNHSNKAGFMVKQYCAFCSKKIGLFAPKSEKASLDGICLCRKCYSAFWAKQEDPISQAKQLAKLSLNGDLNPEAKRIVVKHIKELIGVVAKDNPSISVNDNDRSRESEGERESEREVDCSANLSNEVVVDAPLSSGDYSNAPVKESKGKGTFPSDSDKDVVSITRLKGSSFLCDKNYSIGGLLVENPCIYISDSGFSFAINSKVLPQTITESDEIYQIAGKSLEQKDLFFFDESELSYFLLWLAYFKDFGDFPPHCFSRFYDGIFHRALVERKNQLSIIYKTIEIIKYNQSMELNVRLFRFIFAVLADCKNVFSQKDKIDICKKMDNLFNFRFYYLKPGWDWDPVSWYLESGMAEYIPSCLLNHQELATAGIRASARGIVLTKAYSRCISILDKKSIRQGSPYLLNTYTNRFVKNYHDEVYKYKTKDWAFKGAINNIEDQSVFDVMDEYLNSDWHHAQLVDSVDENSLIELWIAMPPQYQQRIAELFRSEIEAYIDKEISIRVLFGIFNKNYPDKTKNIWAIGDYYLRYIQRGLKYLGYSLVLSIPIENVKLDTPVWIVKDNKAKEKQEEIINKSNESLFTLNDKGRIIGISPKVYMLETVHIPGEVGDEWVREIGPEVFANAKKMKHLIIDEGVKVIRNLAFNHCENLEMVELPSTLTEIVSGAFWGCRSLKQFMFPKNVKKIGSGIFSECSSLERVEFNENVKSVGNQMFYGCSSLKEVVLPPLLKSVPTMFFDSCKALESIVISEQIEMIEPSAFADCEKLQSVLFNSDSCAIGHSAFENCLSLSCISLPNNIGIIEDSTFQNCISLKAIEIPANVTHIGSMAFSSCVRLETVVFHNEECTFDDFAFADCVSLKSIILPKITHAKLSSIFQGCKNLKRIAAPRMANKGESFSFLVNSDVEIQFFDD